MFASVKFSDISVDETHVRVLKGRFRGSGEVCIACANADYQISFTGENVCPGCASNTNCAHRPSVIIGERSLSSLGLGYRNPCASGETRERLGRVGMNDAAPRYGHGLLCRMYPFRCGANRFAILSRTGYHPHASVAELLRL